MTPQTDIKDALTGVAGPMVMAGLMVHDNARTAESVGSVCSC